MAMLCCYYTTENELVERTSSKYHGNIITVTHTALTDVEAELHNRPEKAFLHLIGRMKRAGGGGYTKKLPMLQKFPTIMPLRIKILK